MGRYPLSLTGLALALLAAVPSGAGEAPQPSVAPITAAVSAQPARDKVSVTSKDGRLVIRATAAPLGDVLEGIARATRRSVRYEGPRPTQPVTLTIVAATPEEAFAKALEGQALSYGMTPNFGVIVVNLQGTVAPAPGAPVAEAAPAAVEVEPASEEAATEVAEAEPSDDEKKDRTAKGPPLPPRPPDLPRHPWIPYDGPLNPTARGARTGTGPGETAPPLTPVAPLDPTETVEMDGMGPNGPEKSLKKRVPDVE
jgi:hypothetical protein